MSVSNVNSIYGAQMGSNAGYDTPAIKIEEKESNIGAWLCGGLALVATLGVGIAAHKSGKNLSAFKKDDGVLTTAWNGIKSWFGKNGDDVAKNIDDIPAECKTSFKTFFSDGKITSEQKQNIVDNADEISKVFTNKAEKNASKATRLVEIGDISDSNKKAEALADFFRVEKKLKITGDGKLDTTALSLDDKARITRKLGNIDIDNTSITGTDGILEKLGKKYENKRANYNKTARKVKFKIESETMLKDVNKDTNTLANTSADTSTIQNENYNSIIAKRLNRAGAAQKLAGNCKDTSSYINTQNSLTKWLTAGDLTQDEYDNLRAYAEQKFMSENGDDYLKYMTQGLKKANGSEIDFNSLDEESINLLNNKFKGLNITKASSGKTTEQQLIDWKRNNTKSISEYLGLNGCSLSASDASGFKLVDGKLVWEASAEGGIAPDKIFNIDIGENCTKTKESGTVTRKTLNLDNIKKIFKSATA